MFLLFGGDKYYASGGGYDFIASYENVRDAVETAKKLTTQPVKGIGCRCNVPLGWAHIVDASTMCVVLHINKPFGSGCQQVKGIDKRL